MHKHLHIRQCNLDSQMLSTGGLTVAYVANDGIGGICWHYAKCHPKDLFSRKIGRELASHRLMTEGPYEVLTFDHPIAGRIRNALSSMLGIVIECDDQGRWMSDFIDWDAKSADAGYAAFPPDWNNLNKLAATRDL